MKEEKALSLVGINSPTISLLPSAQNAKAAALAAANAITTVTTAEDVAAVAKVMGEIKGLKKLMTDSHAEVKAPILTITRQIDETKKIYLAGLETEERRLSLLLGAHQDRERRKAEEARRAAELEAQRIAREAEDARRARIAEEQKGRTGTLLPDLEKIQDEAAERIVETQQEAANAADLAPSGTILRKNWKFEVEDIHALYAAHPELVKLEPNKAAINAIIKSGRKLPGLRIWSESVATVTAASADVAQIAEQYDY